MKLMEILRYTGVGLLALALVLTWLKVTWVALGALVAVGILDIVLAFKKGEKTISQWIHKQFVQWIDTAIMIGLCVFTWAVWGPAGFLPVVMGVIIGHLFWHED